MLKVIEDKAEIKRLQDIFVKKYKQFFTRYINVKISHRGPHGGYADTVSYSKELGLWLLPKTKRTRYWNSFGIGEPPEGSSVSIVAEINFPLSGVNRQIAAAFVKDETGNVFVVHNGRIGGGKRGVGKSLFLNNYRGARVVVNYGKKEITVALISDMDSPHFARQISQFVYEVDRIKKTVSNTNIPIAPPPEAHEFNREFAGGKHYRIERNVKADCNHGLIVNDLGGQLEEFSFKVANDINRDLYIVDSSGNINCIFEIKTEISTTNLYLAIGQLLLNSIDLKNQPKLILVVPENVSRVVNQRLRKIGIETLEFSWDDNKVVFSSLDRFRNSEVLR